MKNKLKIYYKRGTEELKRDNIRAHKLTQELNNTDVEEFERKEDIIRKLFGSVGDNCMIGPNVGIYTASGAKSSTHLQVISNNFSIQ
ncbi:acetyltransferase [Priestia megaterium]|uniref:maltose acetyltransferase domain-containing protein n=1 Tax=Priestia megaterium TaxID=1404 RepID=UPI000BEBC21E|nr:maltose acetyltransferase domain-containing protein [Priestia megaterium]PEA36910.1 acetyltransferase [Priestia megaterium]PGX43221.1 acetyltransferase [Priestia megaterium]